MYFLQVALLLIGVVSLVIGYRKNSRNILLVAAIVLFFSAGLNSMVNGFTEGYTEVRDSH